MIKKTKQKKTDTPAIENGPAQRVIIEASIWQKWLIIEAENRRSFFYL